MNFWNQDILTELSGVEKKQFLAKRRIVKQLYRNGSMSVAELSKQLLLSTPTAVNYVNSLIEEGYIEEKGLGESIGGRKPMYYDLKPNSFYLLGIDVGRKGVKIALFSNKLECFHKWEEKAFDLSEGENLIDLLETYVNEFVKETLIESSQIVGVGLIMPGLIDSSKGVNYTFLKKESENLSEELSKRFNRPVFVENDAKARALAELRYGTAQGSKNALVIFIGYGLGLGMILNGKLHLGKSGFAGEFSHIPIENNRLFCNCGKTGCLETIASGEALVRMANEGIKKGMRTVLTDRLADGKTLLPEMIVEAALAGDQLSFSVVNEVGVNLGRGIAYLVQILNPDKIVLSGKVAEAGEFLINSISQTLYQYCLPKLKEDVVIEMSTLGADAGIISAATLVMERVLEN
ncbi:ROK family transcriptional regulator [Saccharicrinis aurantiacus]|uniref:ROK family transcriptional regulator n=1 Tax=Saccharicrinis aurantiacus TaxID=1849719 RepID=UPI002490E2E9|nr:ROK family transcriptional regulator [Saccharicrinis aurantiacus]